MFSSSYPVSSVEVTDKWNQYVEGMKVGNDDGKVSIFEMALLSWYVDYDNDPATGENISPYVQGITPVPQNEWVKLELTFHMGHAFKGIPGCENCEDCELCQMQGDPLHKGWVDVAEVNNWWIIATAEPPEWNVPQADGIDLNVTAAKEDFPGKPLILPGDPVTMHVLSHWGPISYWDVYFTGVGDGYTVKDNMHYSTGAVMRTLTCPHTPTTTP
jgi:hypothetical protein